MKYEPFTSEANQTFIRRFNDDGSISDIPTDPANADYQAYLNKDTLPSNSSIPQAGE
jgi:hypothetical protein